MISFIKKKQTTFAYRALSAFIALTFIFSVIVPPTPIYAQSVPLTILNLPLPGTMVSLTPSFNPPLVKGITIHPENPLKFDFLISPGDNELQGLEFRNESKKLIKYFLAGLTVPDNELWVNLSPYEKNRVISDQFGTTEMGRDMLAQDYILKQLTASLMYPENELGKKFWDRVYKKAYEQYGTTEIPMNTFNKIWIVPQKAVVYEHEQTAFVVESHLKVMLEEDYVAMDFHRKSTVTSRAPGRDEADEKIISGVSSEIVREILIPEIEKEVNEGKIFTQLRQIYNSIILATWYKDNLKESLLGKIYVDQGKTKGIDIADEKINQKIYDQYVEAFKKGVYNYIKEDYDPATKQIIPRKYFSGGNNFGDTRALRNDVLYLTGDQVESVSSPVSRVEVELYADNPTNQAVVAAAQKEFATAGFIASSPLNEEDRVLLSSAEEQIKAVLEEQYNSGAVTEEIYQKSLDNAFPNLKEWTENKEIYRLAPEIRTGNLEFIRQGRWDDIVEAYRQEIAFGTAGIRGKAALTREELLRLKEDGPSAQILKGPNTINNFVLMHKTAGLIKLMKETGKKRIIIGYDSRIAGDQMAQMLARLFIAQSTLDHQFKLFLFDEASPFPELTFGIRTKEVKADFGILISASHNPADYNGYKLTRENGAQLNQEMKEKVLDAVNRVDISEIELADSIGDAQKAQVIWLGGKTPLPGKDYFDFPLVDMHTLYSEQVQSFIIDRELVEEHGSSVNIGFSAFNGAGYKAGPRMFREAGFPNVTIVSKLQELDGLFPAFNWGEQPDPGDPIAADIAIRELIDEHGQEAFDQLDVLFGLDPDADRMGSVVKVPENQQKYFGKYRLLSANDAWTLLLWYRLMRKQQKGQLDNPENHAVVFSHVTTDAIEAVANLFGVKAVGKMLDKAGTEERGDYLNGRRTWVGFTYLAEIFEELEVQGILAEIGAEESNGVSMGGHVNDKDGAFAAILIAEIAAYAKANDITLFELLDDIYRSIGHYATANKPLPRVGSFEGAAGISEKIRIMRKTQEWYAQANERAGTDSPFQVAGKNVIGSIEFKSGRVDHLHYEDAPDEGVRLFFEDPAMGDGAPFTDSKNYITLRISGTSQTLRFYTQIFSYVHGEGKELARQKAQNYFEAERTALEAQKQILTEVNLLKYAPIVDEQLATLQESPLAQAASPVQVEITGINEERYEIKRGARRKNGIIEIKLQDKDSTGNVASLFTISTHMTTDAVIKKTINRYQRTLAFMNLKEPSAQFDFLRVKLLNLWNTPKPLSEETSGRYKGTTTMTSSNGRYQIIIGVAGANSETAEIHFTKMKSPGKGKGVSFSVKRTLYDIRDITSNKVKRSLDEYQDMRGFKGKTLSEQLNFFHTQLEIDMGAPFASSPVVIVTKITKSEAEEQLDKSIEGSLYSESLLKLFEGENGKIAREIAIELMQELMSIEREIEVYNADFKREDLLLAGSLSMLDFAQTVSDRFNEKARRPTIFQTRADALSKNGRYKIEIDSWGPKSNTARLQISDTTRSKASRKAYTILRIMGAFDSAENLARILINDIDTDQGHPEFLKLEEPSDRLDYLVTMINDRHGSVGSSLPVRAEIIERDIEYRKPQGERGRYESTSHENGNDRFGWVNRPWELTDGFLEQVEEEAARLREEGKELAVVAMGGESSSIGTWGAGVTVFDTTSPNAFERQVETINLENIVWYVISNSFGTAETMRNAEYIEGQYRSAGLDPTDHIVFFTNPSKEDGADKKKNGFSVRFRERFTVNDRLATETIGGRNTLMTLPTLLAYAFRLPGKVKAMVEAVKKAHTFDTNNINPWMVGAYESVDLFRNGRNKLAIIQGELSKSRKALSQQQQFEESLGKNEDGFTVYTKLPDLATLKRMKDEGWVFLELQHVGHVEETSNYAADARAEGHPVITIPFESEAEFTPEVSFYGLETYVATLGSLLGINVSDQDGVEAYKGLLRSKEMPLEEMTGPAEESNSILTDGNLEIVVDGIMNTLTDNQLSHIRELQAQGTSASDIFAELIVMNDYIDAITVAYYDHIDGSTTKFLDTLTYEIFHKTMGYASKDGKGSQVLHGLQQNWYQGPKHQLPLQIIPREFGDRSDPEYHSEGERIIKEGASANHVSLVKSNRPVSTIIVNGELNADAQAKIERFFLSVAYKVNTLKAASSPIVSKRAEFFGSDVLLNGIVDAYATNRIVVTEMSGLGSAEAGNIILGVGKNVEASRTYLPGEKIDLQKLIDDMKIYHQKMGYGIVLVSDHIDFDLENNSRNRELLDVALETNVVAKAAFEQLTAGQRPSDNRYIGDIIAAVLKANLKKADPHGGPINVSLAGRLDLDMIADDITDTHGKDIDIYGEDREAYMQANQALNRGIQKAQDPFKTVQKKIKGKKRYVVLTGGGPASGHNKVLEALVKEAEKQGIEIIGIRKGWMGLAKEDLAIEAFVLTSEGMKRHSKKGGTILRTERLNPFSEANIQKGVPAEVVKNIMVTLEADGLITMGGDDTSGAALKLLLTQHDFPIISVPKTMDNDLPLPDHAPTYGYDSFTRAAARYLLAVIGDIQKRDKVLVVEAFGRSAGFAPLHIGKLVKATRTLIPEVEIDLYQLIEDVREYYQKYGHATIVVSEGTKINAEKYMNQEILDRAFENDPVAKAAYETALSAGVDEFGHPKLQYTGDIIAAVLRAHINESDDEEIEVKLAGKLDYNFRSADTSVLDLKMTAVLGKAAIDYLREGKSNKLLYVDRNSQPQDMMLLDDTIFRIAKELQFDQTVYLSLAHIGSFIRSKRAQAGLGVSELAERVGISREAMLAIEKGSKDGATQKIKPRKVKVNGVDREEYLEANQALSSSPLTISKRAEGVDFKIRFSSQELQELESLGLSRGDIIDILTDSELHTTAKLSYGFSEGISENPKIELDQFDIIKRDVESLVRQRMSEKSQLEKRIAIGAIGIGNGALEIRQIIDMVRKVIQSLDGDQADQWNVDLVGMDIGAEDRDDLNGSSLEQGEVQIRKYLEANIGQDNIVINVRTMPGNAIDVEHLKKMKGDLDFDYVFNRRVSYLNSSAGNNNVSLSGFKKSITNKHHSDLVTVFNRVKQIKAIFSTLIAPGTRYITEPAYIGRYSTAGQEADRTHRYLDIDGTEVLTSEAFDLYPAATGVYRVIDPALVAQSGIADFLQRIEDSDSRVLNGVSSPVGANKASSPIREILIIGNTEKMRDTFALMITTAFPEIKVIIASSGREGIAAIESNKIDFVVMSHTLPGIKSEELAQYIKSTKPGVPIILASSNQEESAQFKNIDFSEVFSGVITELFDINRVRETINEFNQKGDEKVEVSSPVNLSIVQKNLEIIKKSDPKFIYTDQAPAVLEKNGEALGGEMTYRINVDDQGSIVLLREEGTVYSVDLDIYGSLMNVPDLPVNVVAAFDRQSPLSRYEKKLILALILAKDDIDSAEAMLNEHQSLNKQRIKLETWSIAEYLYDKQENEEDFKHYITLLNDSIELRSEWESFFSPDAHSALNNLLRKERNGSLKHHAKIASSPVNVTETIMIEYQKYNNFQQKILNDTKDKTVGARQRRSEAKENLMRSTIVLQLLWGFYRKIISPGLRRPGIENALNNVIKKSEEIIEFKKPDTIYKRHGDTTNVNNTLSDELSTVEFILVDLLSAEEKEELALFSQKDNEEIKHPASMFTFTTTQMHDGSLKLILSDLKKKLSGKESITISLINIKDNSEEEFPFNSTVEDLMSFIKKNLFNIATKYSYVIQMGPALQNSTYSNSDIVITKIPPVSLPIKISDEIIEMYTEYVSQKEKTAEIEQAIIVRKLLLWVKYNQIADELRQKLKVSLADVVEIANRIIEYKESGNIADLSKLHLLSSELDEADKKLTALLSPDDIEGLDRFGDRFKETTEELNRDSDKKKESMLLAPVVTKKEIKGDFKTKSFVYDENERYRISVEVAGPMSGWASIHLEDTESDPSLHREFKVILLRDDPMDAKEIARMAMKIINTSISEDPEIKLESLETRIMDVFSKIKASSPVSEIGGINLNPALMDLQIKRDGNGIPLPFNLQPAEIMNIDGLIPVIINVTPIMNVPLLLGFDTPQTDEKPYDSADSNTSTMKLGFIEKYRSKYTRQYHDEEVYS